MQRRALRIVAGLNYRDECRSEFQNLKILTFPSIFIYECLVYAYRNYEFSVKNGDVHGYNTRLRDDIRPHYMRLEKSKNGPNFLAHKFFNKIPVHLRGAPLKRFRAVVLDHLKQKAYFSVEEFLGSDIILR